MVIAFTVSVVGFEPSLRSVLIRATARVVSLGVRNLKLCWLDSGKSTIQM